MIVTFDGRTFMFPDCCTVHRTSKGNLSIGFNGYCYDKVIMTENKVYFLSKIGRIHRAICAFYSGRNIAGKDVHHIDGNCYNNMPSNLVPLDLVPLDKKAHMLLHSKGETQ